MLGAVDTSPAEDPMRLLFTASAIVLMAHTAAAQQPIRRAAQGDRDERAHRVDSVYAAFDRTDSPGCSVGVYQDGKTIYARGYGMANLELGVANNARTVF